MRKENRFDAAYLLTILSLLLLIESFCALATYNAGSMTFGIGLISVPNSRSIRCKLKRSSYVIRLMAIPVDFESKLKIRD